MAGPGGGGPGGLNLAAGIGPAAVQELRVCIGTLSTRSSISAAHDRHGVLAAALSRNFLCLRITAWAIRQHVDDLLRSIGSAAPDWIAGRRVGRRRRFVGR